jgi:hypothetical protein
VSILFSGSRSFARVSCPPAQRNAERVNSADARDLRLDLYRGYRARLSKKAANPACRCRNACYNGRFTTSPMPRILPNGYDNFSKGGSGVSSRPSTAGFPRREHDDPVG